MTLLRASNPWVALNANAMRDLLEMEFHAVEERGHQSPGNVKKLMPKLPV